MAKKLTSYVHVHDAENGTQVFGPGDKVPAAAAKQIVNPKVWEGEDDEELPPPDGGSPEQATRARKS